MPYINCRFPITIRLMGNVSDVELQQLSDVLERTLVGRIALADQTLATSYPHMVADTDRRLVQEEWDPSREGPTSYVIPSYNGKGQPTPVPLKKSAATLSRRPWFIRVASNF